MASNDLWGSLLRESSKRLRYPDSICIVLGDSECGKTKIVEKLCSTSTNGKNANVSSSSSENASREIMSYNYFEIDEVLANSEVPSKVGIWSIGGKCFNGALETIVRSNKIKTERVLFVICVDLSRPEEQCTKSLEKWLLHIANFSKTHHDSTGAANTAKDSLLHYLQHAKHFKIMPDISSIVSSDLSSEASSEISSLKMNLGFPIIVVGCKADLIGSQNDSGDINNAKEIQGRIRALSLQFGAALVYTSAEKATNIVNLRKYMYHRLYPEVIPSNLVIEDNVESAIVPAGFDRLELIEISTGIRDVANTFKSTSDWEKLAIDGRNTPNQAAVQSVGPDASISTADMESEDEWLTGLQNYIKQGKQLALSFCDLTPALPASTAASTGSIASTSSETSVGATRSQRNSGSVEVEAETVVTSTQTAAPAGIATSRPKRGAAANASATSGQDVNSFFQNLLAKK